jgi:two-component system nitrate/nitrite response regulator NarL
MRKLVQAGIDLPMLCIDLLEPLKHDGSIDRSPDVASAANALESYLGTQRASPSKTPYRIPEEIRKTRPSSGDDVPPLSERELDVAGLIMDGLPNRVIAQCLGLSEGTVKVHIRNIMIKLRVKNRGEPREAFPDWVVAR